MASTNTQDAEPPNPTGTPARRPYKGSCHCGFVRYVAWMALPPERPPRPAAPPLPPATSSEEPSSEPAPAPVPAPAPLSDGMRVYRCNCTRCHKTGLLHVRLASSPDDFVLLSPLDPLHELADYLCYDRVLHGLSCRTCGVHCIMLAGEGEVVEVDDPEAELESAGGGAGGTGGDDDRKEKDSVQKQKKKVKVWRPKKEGWKERGRNPEDAVSYLSVNGQTLDAEQEGLDLRVWTEEKRVLYLDCFTFEGGRTYERPQRWGSY